MSDVSEGVDPLVALAEFEKRRNDRRATEDKQRAVQRLTDMQALDAFERERGTSLVLHVDFDFVEGLPTLAIMRAPEGVELTRYRLGVRPKKEGDIPDTIRAAEELGFVTVLYPDKSTLQKMCDARPSFMAQCGLTSLKIAGGKAASDAKS